MRKKKNKSIIPGDSDEYCYICGRYMSTGIHVHHCLYGSNRKNADKYNLIVHLCPDCHIRLHDHGDHAEELKMKAQEAFEHRYGHEIWMKVFGKNYLSEETEREEENE